MKISGATIDEALLDMSFMRKFRPFAYSGKWFVTKFDNQFYAFRSKAPIQKRLNKIGGEMTVKVTEIQL